MNKLDLQMRHNKKNTLTDENLNSEAMMKENEEQRNT